MHLILSSSELIQSTLLSVLSNHVQSGYLLSKLLSAPYSRDEVYEILEQGAMKEFQIMQSTPRQPSVRWLDWMLDQRSQLHNDIPYNPPMLEFAHQCLDKWIQRVSSKVFYPQTSTKTISAFSRPDYFEYRNEEDYGQEVTTLILEQLYSDVGYQVTGPCEMRQRWYPTNTKPRTYFAMGGSAYHNSKFCGPIFEELTNSFPPTEKYRRVRPDLISVDEDEEVYIYDLTAFSSSMHEHKWFISALAQYVSGVEVRIFDSYHGLCNVNLSSLLFEYLDSCCHPVYMTKLGYGMSTSIEYVHNVAGFLGVYGNIMSCTFPHGVVNAQSGRREDSSITAGDDAMNASVHLERHVHDSSETIGSLQREKVFLLSEEGSVALKRPVQYFAGSILKRDNVLWPSFCYLQSDYDWGLRFDSRVTRSDRIRSFRTSLFSFMISLSRVELSLEDRYFVLEILGPIYQELRAPFEGSLMSGKSWPSILVFDLGTDPYEVLLRRFPTYTYLINATIDDIENQDMDLDALSVFEREGSPYLSWLCKMGYCLREEIKVEVKVEDRFADVVMALSGRSSSRPVFRFTMLESVPERFLLD